MLEITVGHGTLSDQILKISSQFHFGHHDWTSQEQILNYLLQGAVSQKIMSSQVCKMSYQKEELKKHRYGE